MYGSILGRIRYVPISGEPTSSLLVTCWLVVWREPTLLVGSTAVSPGPFQDCYTTMTSDTYITYGSDGGSRSQSRINTALVSPFPPAIDTNNDILKQGKAASFKRMLVSALRTRARAARTHRATGVSWVTQAVPTKRSGGSGLNPTQRLLR